MYSIPALGRYTSQTSLTCQARPGSYGREQADAEAYCAMGARYLKIDHCGGAAHPLANASWIKFRAALDACAARRADGRRFLMACSSCNDGLGLRGCGGWIASAPVGCDVWRTGGDIQARWSSIMANLDANDAMAAVQNTHPGHHNDPDMLQVGNVGLSHTEQQAHFSLWCLAGGPLLISTDLAVLAVPALRILTAPELIGVNQVLRATN